ncbi:hypothetical protein [Brevibacillus brevis]|uniref:Uncharacterized protein n=1 Tax=Brevibacillus brevis TaxID=1393 RepID=A0ABY9T711_BREBE|nr:hypothetical protein [Brevibacillus brevis]WNC15901.1 hypothetical protein RGB73_06085 [Brevibacillus brevis]
MNEFSQSLRHYEEALEFRVEQVIMQKKRRSLWLRQASEPCLPDRLLTICPNILMVFTMHRSLDSPFLAASPDFYA